MPMGTATRVTAESRGERRDEVFHRARATRANGRALPLLVVNVSGGGFMARCEEDFAVGDRVAVKLPVIGAVGAEVRWSLGGRIGCQFDQPIPIASYFSVLAAMLQG